MIQTGRINNFQRESGNKPADARKRAHFGRLLADMDMAAVGALPDHIAVAGEHEAVFNVAQQLAIAFFMLFFDLGDAFKQRRNVVKPSSRASLAKVAYMSVHS